MGFSVPNDFDGKVMRLTDLVGIIDETFCSAGPKPVSQEKDFVESVDFSVYKPTIRQKNDERRLLSASNKTGRRIISPDEGGTLEKWNSTQRIILFNSVFKAWS